MNPLVSYAIGQVVAGLIGVGIGLQYSLLLGSVAYYATAVLVDIRYELERLNTK